ncbi:MAG: alanine--tRNA ligase [Patescibacteria group bacterium]
MHSSEIRTRFLKFFENRGHKIIPSASLVPENDPSVLFNTAGMQPLVPYLLGQEHPMGRRIANVQKCVRTGDLDDIGDNRHFSFFEMMGNWSLGDPSSPDGIGAGYFKEDAIKWSYEFLTSKEEGLGLDVSRLYVTIFEGDENAPYDQESKDIWMSLGIPEHRIYSLPGDDNWWSPGDNGPCGPSSEMFYDMSGNIGDLTKEGFIEACEKEDVIEIWNDVFMEYEKKDGKVIGKLKQKNVDTGAGLERITAVMQGKKTAYDTDLFEFVTNVIKSQSKNYNEHSSRVVADHIRTAVFLISDGVLPGNKDQGYVLRRLLRRTIRHSDLLALPKNSLASLSLAVVNQYEEIYTNLRVDLNQIQYVIEQEEIKFRQTLENGLKEFEKGIDPFILATTYGFPIELTEELAKEKGIKIDREDFNTKMSEHQKLSQTASAGMFKGGLANHNEKTIRLHTAHHLLLAALQEVVSPEIKQRGSNITEERLRIDFVCDHKLTDEEKQKVEDLVNQKIQANLNVVRREMPLAEAEKIGAQMEFGAKYPETVSVYFIGEENPSTSSGRAFSAEFCGGPHVSNTGELGIFKIQKEEAVSAGVRRIKAILE